MPRAAPKLNDEQRLFCVRCFARFLTPLQVVEALKADYGVEISRQAACFYSPKHNRAIAKKYLVLHEAARKAFIDDQSGIPIAHLSHRLEALSRIAAKAEEMGNTPEARAALEQAAKDKGGLFTSHRQIAVTGIESLIQAAAAAAGEDVE